MAEKLHRSSAETSGNDNIENQIETSQRSEINRPSAEKHHHKQEHQVTKAELDQISKKAEKQAMSSEDRKPDHNQDKAPSPQYHGSAFPEFTANQTINRVRHRLKPVERSFSKVIHNPAVEAISDVAGGTIARPSGLLYGGLFSLIASAALYLITKHYGYEYSFFIAIATFVGGFALGLIIEMISKVFIRKSS